MYTSVLSGQERVVKIEDNYGSKHCSGSALLSTGSIIKHSLNNGAVLTMENKVLPNALKVRWLRTLRKTHLFLNVFGESFTE